jgi:hypothetical protein
MDTMDNPYCALSARSFNDRFLPLAYQQQIVTSTFLSAHSPFMRKVDTIIDRVRELRLCQYIGIAREIG